VGGLGTLGRVTVANVRVAPRIVTPNGDGRGDKARIEYRLGAGASVTATVVDRAGAPLATLFSGRRTRGKHSFVWKDVGVPDGRYQLRIQAVGAGGTEAAATAALTVDRTLAAFESDTNVISPNGDGELDAATMSFRLAAAAEVRLEIRRGAKLVATVLSGRLHPGPQHVVWTGSRLGDGRYSAVVEATDSLLTVAQRLPLTIDTTPPRLRLLSLRKLLFWISEPATVTVELDGKKLTKTVFRGRFRLPPRRFERLSAVAVDRAGNQSRRLSAP
jgi:hypothetical protein